MMRLGWKQTNQLIIVTAAAALPGLGCGHDAAKSVAVNAPTLHSPASLTVTSPSFQAKTRLSRLYSSYGSNIEPDIRWANAAGARSYVLLVEDPDAPGKLPFVHWLVSDLPANRTSDGIQGENGLGSIGYYGPHPPIGDEPHHYHFEVFALDKKLGLPGGANRAAVIAAMAGHIVGSGEIVGTYEER